MVVWRIEIAGLHDVDPDLVKLHRNDVGLFPMGTVLFLERTPKVGLAGPIQCASDRLRLGGIVFR